MEQIYPDYYEQFACIGGACEHNCCIGWEIDIDEDTLALYESAEGPLGERLRRSISYDGTPHFILDEKERCPFLNEQNLCDIITELGKPCLCDVCAVHPRFVNEWEGRCEKGLGLCCEAAGALILSKTTPVRLLGTAPVTPLTLRRDALIAALQERDRPVLARLQALCPASAVTELALRFQPTEELDPRWRKRLTALARDFRGEMLPPFADHMAARDTEYEQLAVYLLYRHFPAALENVLPFVADAVRLIYALGALQYHQTGAFTLADQVELCRLFSAEIEYSDENLTALMKGA